MGTSEGTSAKGEGTPLVIKEETSENMFGHKVASVAAICALIAIAVTKTQLTSVLFSTLHYPTAYSFYSCVVTDALLIPAFLLVPSQWGVPKQEMFLGPHYALTLIIVFTTFDLAFTNIALSEISISLQQCIAATNPAWTILIESLLHRKWQHPIIYAVVIGLVVGAVLQVVSDITRISTLGVFAAVAAVLCSACKGAFTHNAFRQYKKELSALALLFWVDLLMMIIFIPWVLINGELVALLDSNMSAGQWWQFTGTAALGGVRALTQFVVLRLVTATSMSTANIFTMALNVLLSFIIPQTHTPSVTPLLIIGICMVVTFAGLYAYLKSSKDACFGVMLPKSNGADAVQRSSS